MKRIALSTSVMLLLAACGSASEDEATANAPAAAASEAAGVSEPQGEEVHILAFGDSLFAGYGVDAQESYPAQLETALRGRGINASVVNGGVSGDTTQAGRDRFAFTLKGQIQKPDLVIIELGGNDLLRGLSPDQTRANLEAMLEVAKENQVPAMLFGMRAPPNMGAEFVREYDSIWRDLAAEYDAALVPFFLEAIYRDPANFQSDRIHPTAAAIGLLVQDTVARVVEALPEEVSAE